MANENTSNNEIAIEGAKQLVEAKKMSLNASYSDDHNSRNTENETANKLEVEAYKKLASVTPDKAKALVDLEREKIINDDQLKNSISLDLNKLSKETQLKTNPAPEVPLDFNAKFDRAIRDAELRDFGREGVPMDSIPNSKIHYNELKGMLGAQIISKDGLSIDFGGKESIEAFAKEKNLTDFEKKMMLDFDELAKREIELGNNPKQSTPAIPLVPQDERDAELRKRFDDHIKNLENPQQPSNEENTNKFSVIRNTNDTKDILGEFDTFEKASFHAAGEQDTKDLIFKEGDRTLPKTEQFNNYLDAMVEARTDPFVEPSKTELNDLAKVAYSSTFNNQENLLTLDQATKDRLADNRAREFSEAQKQLNNSIESTTIPTQQKGENSVVSDEMFVSGKDDVKTIPPEIEKQYLKMGDKYHFVKSPDAVAFEDFGNKLETKSNNNGVAESMVRIAAARGWDEIKVQGSETFRKEVWLEAASRGMHVKGFTPTEQDKNELAQRSKDLEANKIEKSNEPFRARENEKLKTAEKTANNADKDLAKTFKDKEPSEVVKLHPELTGAVAALTVMEKQAAANGLSPQQLAVVSARLRENISNSIERGNLPEVKIKEELEVTKDAKFEREYQR